MFITGSLDFTPKNLIVRSGKSEAKVTNNKILQSIYCTVEANADRYEASRGLSATAELLELVAPDICLRGISVDLMLMIILI